MEIGCTVDGSAVMTYDYDNELYLFSFDNCKFFDAFSVTGNATETWYYEFTMDVEISGVWSGSVTYKRVLNASSK